MDTQVDPTGDENVVDVSSSKAAPSNKPARKRSRSPKNEDDGTSIKVTLSSSNLPLRILTGCKPAEATTPPGTTLTYPQLLALLYPASHHTVTPLTAASIPDVAQVTTLTNKALAESPPYVHLSVKDCSNSLKLPECGNNQDSAAAMCLAVNCANSSSRGDKKWLAVGYRMIRASHGASPPEQQNSLHH